jgi:hypothetical protein
MVTSIHTRKHTTLNFRKCYTKKRRKEQELIFLGKKKKQHTKKEIFQQLFVVYTRVKKTHRRYILNISK